MTVKHFLLFKAQQGLSGRVTPSGFKTRARLLMTSAEAQQGPSCVQTAGAET